MIEEIVLKTSCQVSEKWKTGPRATQTTTARIAARNAQLLPAPRVVASENFSSIFMSAPGEGPRTQERLVPAAPTAPGPAAAVPPAVAPAPTAGPAVSTPPMS